jgi:cytochrome c oxidase subunit III
MQKQVSNSARLKPYEQSVQRRFFNYRTILYMGMAAMALLFFTMSMLYLFSKPYSNDGRMQLPILFISNTLLVFLSSLALAWARIYFERDNSRNFRIAIWVAGSFGILFLAGQVAGLVLLHQSGFDLIRNNAASYLWVISGLHGIHLLGGLIFWGYYVYRVHQQLSSFALTPVFFSDPVNRMQLKLFATYWHFLGVVWLYLLAFFLILG